MPLLTTSPTRSGSSPIFTAMGRISASAAALMSNRSWLMSLVSWPLPVGPM